MTARIKTSVESPPHRRWELDQARLAVVGAVRELVAQGAPLPPMVVEAWKALDRLEQENHEHEERQRLARMAIPMHYTGKADDRQTLCGLRTELAPHGWVGVGNEFMQNRIRNGGAVCPACLERA